MKPRLRMRSLGLGILLLLKLAPAPAVYGITPDDPSIVGVWLFDEGTGKVVADVKNANNATMSSVLKWDTGKFGGAVVANGNGVINVKNSPSINSVTEQLTVAGWFRIDTDSDTGIRRDNAFLLEDQSATEPVPNGFSFRIWTDQGLSPGIYGKTELTQGEWYHIAGTYDGSKMELYVNGQPESANGLLSAENTETDGAWTGMFVATTNTLQLKYGSESLFGAIDETMIFNRALSGEEIRQLMGGWASIAPQALPGDVNADGKVDVADIDALSAAIRAASTQAVYDLNKDGSVSELDHGYFVVNIMKTWIGDVDFNGSFDSGDFVSVFVIGEYEDEVAGNSGWAEGDWNGDGDFDSADFVEAFQDGGFEAGPRPATAAVPEPTSALLTVVPVMLLGIARRRRC